jgi:hypothetical protein
MEGRVEAEVRMKFFLVVYHTKADYVGMIVLSIRKSGR